MISKCQEKKNKKKFEKIKSRLSDKYGIKFSSQPTEIIVIANAGLANDVKRHELEFYFSSFNDHIKEIITPPGLTFAIILTNSCILSEEIFEKLHVFNISTPDFPSRPSVNAFCIYSTNLPVELTADIIDFNKTLPPGLIIIEDFICQEEEQILIKYIMNLSDNNMNNSLKQRTVIHYGYEFNYDTNLVDCSKPLIDKPIPKCGMDLLEKLQSHTGKTFTDFDQLTVNIYYPGNGIPPHIDTHSIFYEEIISVSLNSDVIMEWTNPESSEQRHVDLKSRSACIMTGESRYLWRHGIPSRKSDLIYFKSENRFEKRQRSMRISLTFRRVKFHRDCRCQWPQYCDIDRKKADNGEKFSPQQPGKLEEEFVHRVYDNIADHFSSTRHSMWPRVRNFIDQQPIGGVGADIGCGNGKYFPAILKRGFLLGSDSSFNLCRIASQLHRVDALVQSNCLQLPFRDGCCDFLICIAVLHHLSTSDRREEAIDKLSRLLVKGGRGLIYVWAQEQQKDGAKSKYLTKKSKDSTVIDRNDQVDLPIHLNGTQFSKNDMLVPWYKKSQRSGAESEVYTRYYHLFIENELEDLCERVDGIRVVDRWYDSGNWAVVFEKLI